MSKKDFILQINDEDQLIIRPFGPYDIASMSCCNTAKVYLRKINSEKRLLFGNNIPFFHDWLHNFFWLLYKALKQELHLPTELKTNNIGYLYNQYVKNSHKDYKIKSNISDFHVCSYKNTSVWVYNNDQNEIVLEITPNYPYYKSSEKIKNIIPYKKFLRKYKSEYITTIPIDKAYQCFKKTIDLVNLINQNAQELRQQNQTEKEEENDELSKKMPWVLDFLYGPYAKDIPQKDKELFIKCEYFEYKKWFPL